MRSIDEIKEDKMALILLKQDQTYWEAKWRLANRKSMIDYINKNTADTVRETAIKVGLEIDDLLLT